MSSILFSLLHSAFICVVEGLDYKDRACCESGSDEPSAVCSITFPDNMVLDRGQDLDTDTKMSSAAWGGIVVVVLFVVLPIVRLCHRKRKLSKQMSSSSTQGDVSLVPVPVPTTNIPVATAVPSTADAIIHVKDDVSPSAPALEPPFESTTNI